MDIGVWFGNGARKPRRRAKASADSYVLCIARPVMRKREGLEGLFDGRHFDREIIVLCVRWYLRYKLSFRDLVEMKAERVLSLAHTTILRWVRRYASAFVKRWNRHRRLRDVRS